jgi:3-oxoacyl-ACP reductase-like protein
MSIFGNIIGKIFGTTPAEAAPAAAAPAPDASAPAAADPAQVAAAAGAPATVPADVAANVDIVAVLDDLDDKNPETLDWRSSIVDLLKVLGLDSSLTARKELASELKYDGDTSDSASMNVWLHKKVIDLVAANGGKVPGDLLAKK